MDRFLVPLVLAGLALALILLLLWPSPASIAPGRPILIEDASGALAMTMSPLLAPPAQLGETSLSVSASDAAGVWGDRLERPADLAAKSLLSVCVEHAAGLFGDSLDASPSGNWATGGEASVLSEHAAGTFASGLRAPPAALAGERSQVPNLVLVEHAAGALGEVMSLPADAAEGGPPIGAPGYTGGTGVGILIDGADGLQAQRLLPIPQALENRGASERGGNP